MKKTMLSLIVIIIITSLIGCTQKNNSVKNQEPNTTKTIPLNQTNEPKINTFKKIPEITNNQQSIYDKPNEIVKNFLKNLPTDAELTYLQEESIIFQRSDKRYMGIKGTGINIQVNQKNFSKLNSALKDYLNKNNFQSMKQDTPLLEENILYIKDNLKCEITENVYTENEIFKSLKFYCGEENEKTEKDFNDFYPLLTEIEANKNDSFDSYVVVLEADNDFAQGAFGSVQGGGAMFLAKKVNEKWEIIFKGQDIPPCHLVEDFPVSFYNSCYQIKK